MDPEEQQQGQAQQQPAAATEPQASPAAVVATPTPEQPAAATPPSNGAVDLGAVRELVLAAYPEVVAELVGGDSFDAILASVEPARAAYQRISARLEQAHAQAQPAAAATATGTGTATPAARPAVVPAAPFVPAGQPGRSGLPNGVEALSPAAKIAEGLRRRAPTSIQSMSTDARR